MNIEQKYIELERQMNQKVKALEDRELIYQEHVNDVAKRVALVRVKLAKNEPSADTNLKLQQESEACQIKINELQEQLNASAHTNMDMTERLMKNFAASRNQLLRNAEVDSKVQSSLRSLLSFVEDWNIKPTVLEMQPKISEEYANVAVAVAESDTAEFSRVGDKCSTFDTLEQQWLLIPSEHKANRLGALNKFKAGECNILICTDVASRGLDIPPVDLVINYDIPYLHEKNMESGEEDEDNRMDMDLQKP
ncbi:hypothetical protein MRB53_018692 [Persea americana]|uniref:Uncharacterized protein n=1 Tax=Persea americana TaxID=3435 RepID=A0ACC2M988_PERAE|nr:hypothetical protein MRB53_018692 [Persea americana]